ncbi:MAG TPA: histidine kinase [Solirubrobacter sp.]|nr:histidine kinase [Solirubrobacter sp.]
MASPPPDALGGRLLVRRMPERRAVVLVAAATMLAAVFVAMRAISDPAPGIGVLAVLPITLVALELGLAGGLSAAALAALLLAVNAAGGHPELGAAGIASRAVAFGAIAAVAGRFSDRMRAAYEREQRLLDSGFELAGGIDADRVSTIVARAAARTPGVQGALVALAEAGPVEVGTPAPHRVAIPIEARGAALGRLEVRAGHALAPEEQAALELLTLQAGLAVDNHLLLIRERERAGIEAELRRLHDELTEQRCGLGQLLDSQEEERQRVAYRLHDELAQVLAAVLMGLRVLARETPDRRAASVEDLRGQITEVLRELREVAGSLRPVSLTQLGLRPALEALAGDVPGRLALDLDGAPDTLDPALETAVYRIVEEALRAGARANVAAGEGALTLDLRLPTEAMLPALRARAEVARGTVDARPLSGGATAVHVTLPRRATVTA